MIKKNIVINKFAQLSDLQLVKLVQYENYDALAELWIRHADYMKKVTLGQYYKVRPDFSENSRNYENLWNDRMGDSYFNLEKAAKNYDFSCGTPFLAFFAIKNRYALLDEKEFNTERTKRYAYCDDYGRYECLEENGAADMQEIIRSIEKCLREDKNLLAFFQKYVAVINERGYINQSKMSLLMGVSRQTINANFKKIRAVAQEHGLEKEFLVMLSAQDKVSCYADDAYLDNAA